MIDRPGVSCVVPKVPENDRTLSAGPVERLIDPPPAIWKLPSVWSGTAW